MYFRIDKTAKPNPEAFPQDIKILGWCPAGSVLPDGEKVPL